MHASHHDVLLREHRGRAVVPEERILAVTLDEVGFPAYVSIQLHGRKRTALEEDVDRLSIGDGRGVAARAVTVLADVFLAENGPPQLAAVQIVRQHGVVPLDRRRQIDATVEHDGG